MALLATPFPFRKAVMSQEAPIHGDAGDPTSFVHTDPVWNGRSTRFPAPLPPSYLRARLRAAIQMTWQDNPRTQLFMATSVQQIASSMRDGGASPEMMLRALRTILGDQLARMSTTRGAHACDDLRLRIADCAVEEFFRLDGSSGSD